MRLRRQEILFSASLALVTLAVFWQVQGFDFVILDDDVYVTQNLLVQSGLTRQSIPRAFTDIHAGLFIPLTWLSLMCDRELYGLNPGGYHLTNLLFHAANTVLLFLLLGRLTGSLRRSAFVAALFALHPLRVESVAWVTERKDVLSACFWMLTTLAYLRYVRKPGVLRYLLVTVLLALGLMAKPMVVTLPLALLLLDYWPLQRSSLGEGRGQPAWRLILEKLPLFALAALCSLLTVRAQRTTGTVVPLEILPLSLRIENALVSYVVYIRKLLWPTDLAVFYPHPGQHLPLWQVVGAALLLVGISVLAIRSARRRPYLVVGWLWYLGTLFPVIGLSQAGEQAMADRFTYVPLIGLFIIISWGIADLAARARAPTAVLALPAGAVLLALAVCTSLQLRHWKDSARLFEHALAVTRRNYIAHGNLGVILHGQRRLAEAIDQYEEAMRVKPAFASALHIHYNLGLALRETGRLAEATDHLEQALEVAIQTELVHNELGVTWAQRGELDRAIEHFSEALRINPAFGAARRNLTEALRNREAERKPAG